MRIGIIAAMEEELRTLRRLLSGTTESTTGPFLFFEGRLCGLDVVLLQCGIGKVNAAVGTALLIERFHPDSLINTGVAGGFPPDKLHIGDIVVALDVRHHDADSTVFNYEYGQIPRMPAAYMTDTDLRETAVASVPPDFPVAVHTGQILSGDSFIHAQRQIAEIRGRFPSIMAVEMEGAAIAQTCYLFSVPFLIIRSISDLVMVEESQDMYENFVVQAAENSVALVLSLLTALHKKGES
ncbi:5'-methylthioadenosine/adenosylhomocysteine nucleosidase [Myxococcota bacterium]|nr:5'-methylthioadenosine/adenosylhomocysteine nucleosidase [Myxococcota bacterium]MBU1536477.1 5'-methylthioadenosine/adenosylhomocysteine nucleosidase [Myxococcota bacterium]